MESGLAARGFLGALRWGWMKGDSRKRKIQSYIMFLSVVSSFLCGKYAGPIPLIWDFMGLSPQVLTLA